MKIIVTVNLRNGKWKVYDVESPKDIAIGKFGVEIYGNCENAFFPLEIIEYIEWREFHG